jgi:hypothetical protein
VLIGYPHENMGLRFVSGKILSVGRVRSVKANGRVDEGVALRVRLVLKKNGYPTTYKGPLTPTLTDTVWMTKTGSGWRSVQPPESLLVAESGDFLAQPPRARARVLSAPGSGRPVPSLAALTRCLEKAGGLKVYPGSSSAASFILGGLPAARRAHALVALAAGPHLGASKTGVAVVAIRYPEYMYETSTNEQLSNLLSGTTYFGTVPSKASDATLDWAVGRPFSGPLSTSVYARWRARWGATAARASRTIAACAATTPHH